jgi:uncharacterized protein (AIM24 family)
MNQILKAARLKYMPRRKDTEMVLFKCDGCGLSKEISDKFANKTVNCPKCKKSVSISGTEGPENANSRYSVDDFVNRTAQKDKGQGLFELESNRLLEINLNGMVWTKMGSMVAYLGSVKFTRESVFEHGVKKLLKRAVTGEGTTLTKAEGQGTLYLADCGKKISIINLQGESICVNGNDLLAFTGDIEWDIKMIKKISGMLAGGLFNVNLSGNGMVAITTHHDPLTLVASPNKPIITDPNATVAWSGSLAPELKTDVSFKTFMGRGSGESIQMKFQGQGFVVIQPCEELYFQTS